MLPWRFNVNGLPPHYMKLQPTVRRSSVTLKLSPSTHLQLRGRGGRHACSATKGSIGTGWQNTDCSMFLKAVGAILTLGLAFAFLAMLLPDIVSGAETARTENAAEALGCTTGAVTPACDITLMLGEHAYADTTAMTVTETTPGAGDRTPGTTVGANRVTLTVAGLSATSTPFTFDVDYKIVDANVSTMLNGVLSRFGILIVLGLLGVMVFWIAKITNAF